MAARLAAIMPGPPVFANPLAMHKVIIACTKDLPQGECFRNFCGTVKGDASFLFHLLFPIFSSFPRSLCSSPFPFFEYISDMSAKNLVIETELFSRASLDFYTKHNLDLITPETNPEDYKQFYSAARGSAQGGFRLLFCCLYVASLGDYRDGIKQKIDNVVSCLGSPSFFSHFSVFWEGGRRKKRRKQKQKHITQQCRVIVCFVALNNAVVVRNLSSK